MWMRNWRPNIRSAMTRLLTFIWGGCGIEMGRFAVRETRSLTAPLLARRRAQSFEIGQQIANFLIAKRCDQAVRHQRGGLGRKSLDLLPRDALHLLTFGKGDDLVVLLRDEPGEARAGLERYFHGLESIGNLFGRIHDGIS